MDNLGKSTLNKSYFKGISPVIATILMVMVTVVLIASLWTWHQGTMNTSTKNTDYMMDASLKAQQTVTIVTVYQCGSDICFGIKAQSSNTYAIPMNGTTYLLNNQPKTTADWDGTVSGPSCNSITTLAPGSICYGKITGTTCRIGDYLKVSLSWGSEATKGISQCS